MSDDIDYEAGAQVLQQIVKELEVRLEDHDLDDRTRRISTELLRVRRLELADLQAYRWGD